MIRAQRKNLSIKMKQVYAKKKAGKDPPPPVEQAKAMQVQEDMKRFGDFQYRRGLVTAMECILRELR